MSDKSLVIVGGAEGSGRWYVYLDALGMKGAREHGAMGLYQGCLRSIYKCLLMLPVEALYLFLYMVFFGTREITYDR